MATRAKGTKEQSMSNRLAKYAASFIAFASDVPIRVDGQQRRFAEVWTAFQKTWLDAIAPSAEAVANGSKAPIGKHWTEAVKGSAKTTMVAMLVLWLVAFSRRALKIQIAASDQEQAAEVRSAAADVLRAIPWLASRVRIDKWAITCRATGSVCDILAADTAGASGGRPDVLVLEELVQIAKEEFVGHLLNNASKIPDGLVLVTTNAGFVGTFQWTLRELARTSDRWRFLQGNDRPPHISEHEWNVEARTRNPAARYARLFQGVWSSGVGDALDESDLLAAVDDTLGPMNGREKGFAFCSGLDLGIRHDHSALVVLGVHGQTQRVRLAACRSWAPGLGGTIDLEAVEDAVLAMHRKFRATVYFDPFQCQLLAQRCKRQGVRMVEIPFTGQHLNRMASDLLDVFRSRRIDLFNEPGLLRDLRRLTIVEKSYGFRLESTRDADGHADKATALALALLGVPKAQRARPAGPWGPLSLSPPATPASTMRGIAGGNRSTYGEPFDPFYKPGGRPSPKFF